MYMSTAKLMVFFQRYIHISNMNEHPESSNNVEIQNSNEKFVIKCLYEKTENTNTCIIRDYNEEYDKNSIYITKYREKQYHTCCLCASFIEKVRMLNYTHYENPNEALKSIFYSLKDIYEIHVCFYNHYKISLINYKLQRKINAFAIENHIRLNMGMQNYSILKDLVSYFFMYNRSKYLHHKDRSVTSILKSFFEKDCKNISLNKNVEELITNKIKQDCVFLTSYDSNSQLSNICEFIMNRAICSIYITKDFNHNIFYNYDKYLNFFSEFLQYNMIKSIRIEISYKNIIFVKAILLAIKDYVESIKIVFDPSKNNKNEILSVCQIVSLHKNQFSNLNLVCISGLGFNEMYTLCNAFLVKNLKFNALSIKIVQVEGEKYTKKHWNNFRDVYLRIYVDFSDTNLFYFMKNELFIYFLHLTIEHSELPNMNLFKISNNHLDDIQSLTNINTFKIRVKSPIIEFDISKENEMDILYKKFYCCLFRIMKNAHTLIIYKTKINFLKYIKDEDLNLKVQILSIVSSTIDISNICKSTISGILNILYVKGFSTIYVESDYSNECKIKINEIRIDYLDQLNLNFLQKNVLFLEVDDVWRNCFEILQKHYYIKDFSPLLDKNIIEHLNISNGFKWYVTEENFGYINRNRSFQIPFVYETYFIRLVYSL